MDQPIRGARNPVIFIPRSKRHVGYLLRYLLTLTLMSFPWTMLLLNLRSKHLDRTTIGRMGYIEDVETKTWIHKKTHQEDDNDGDNEDDENIPPLTLVEPSLITMPSNASNINTKLKAIITPLDKNLKQLDVMAAQFDNID
ncbi:Uncharacterized protein TCM_003069 [Theobroma cacao]|uniref:Uncharacterized protein n=1 Tax=Theobroma cacao TaxID=3641 RepID=A0A061DVH3_THECC|nr:Uncharacterized protein TCM_003069 [Theobroma cacao]